MHAEHVPTAILDIDTRKFLLNSELGCSELLRSATLTRSNKIDHVTVDGTMPVMLRKSRSPLVASFDPVRICPQCTPCTEIQTLNPVKPRPRDRHGKLIRLRSSTPPPPTERPSDRADARPVRPSSRSLRSQHHHHHSLAHITHILHHQKALMLIIIIPTRNFPSFALPLSVLQPD